MKLNNLNNNYFNALQRVGNVDDVDHGIIRDWQELYTTMVTESQTVSTLRQVTPFTINTDTQFA